MDDHDTELHDPEAPNSAARPRTAALTAFGVATGTWLAVVVGAFIAVVSLVGGSAAGGPVLVLFALGIAGWPLVAGSAALAAGTARPAPLRKAVLRGLWTAALGVIAVPVGFFL